MWGSSVSVSVQQCWSAFFSHLCSCPFLYFLLSHAYNATCQHICWHVLACVHAFTQTHTHTDMCLDWMFNSSMTSFPASQQTIIIFLRGSHWTDCQLSTFQRLKSSSQRKCEWSFYFIFCRTSQLTRLCWFCSVRALQPSEYKEK